ncbi:MAG: shikimate kinase [Candidatus Omnitrophica bacterium]|nr:shikimate kinase [Candidatus Omnitrophota bacterium]
MNITLIGMPGVGKSSIGKHLAKILNFTFFDSDRIIEKNSKSSLQQIIDSYGADALLDLEKEIIVNLGNFDKHVLCPGGSVVYSAEAMLFLKSNSRVIFLDAGLEDIKARILDMAVRGIVGLKGDNFSELYTQRLPLYEKYADIRINLSANSNVEQNSQKIIKVIFPHS